MHSVFDKNSTALFAVPEPVFRRKPLVGGVVFEITVQKFSPNLRLDKFLYRLIPRVVSLHEVGDKQKIALAGGGCHFLGLLDA